MSKPTVGRIVNYVLSESDSTRSQGEIRPAIVVRVWPDDYGAGKPGETVQLQVFTDGSNDGGRCAPGVMSATSVHHGKSPSEPGTWHWPTRE